MTTELHLFRVVDGKTKAVKLTIDQSRLIVGEEYSDVIEPGSLTNPTNSHQAHLISQGIRYHTDASGTTIIDHVPKHEQELMYFFTETRPCWFPECEQMRKEYKEELAAAGGASCPNCVKGALIRKYRDRVQKLLGGAPPSAKWSPLPGTTMTNARPTFPAGMLPPSVIKPDVQPAPSSGT